MDQLHHFLETVREQGAARGQLRGLLHVLIGRRITLADGTPISTGLNWREAATLLKRARWDTQSVRELGLNPAELPARDRERFWYTTIGRARIDAPEAVAAGERLARELTSLGYAVGPAPGGK